MSLLAEARARLARARQAAGNSRLASEAGWLEVAKLVQGVCSLAATFVVARYLGPGAYGELSLAIATLALLSAIGTLGLEHIASRELSAGEDAPALTLRALWRMRLAGATFGCAGMLLAAWIAPRFASPIGPLLFVLALVPLVQVGDLAEWRLVAASRSRSVATATLVVAPLAALLRLAMAWQGAGLAAFAWAVVAEWCLRSLLLWLATRPLRAAETGEPEDFARKAMALLKESAPLLLAGIAVFIYMRIDQFMIAGYLGPTQVGLYSAVVVVSEAPLVLPAILLRAALPMLSREASAPAQDAAFEGLMRACFWFHALLALVLAAAAVPLVRLLYGEAYLPAVEAFRIVVLGAPFVALGVVSSGWLVIRRCTGHALRRTLLGMAVNIVLNVVLIPRMGIAGAALATLLAQLSATYAADYFHAETRALFRMKTRSLNPLARAPR
jgi:O-antigen/teichoic acid export membrane protein